MESTLDPIAAARGLTPWLGARLAGAKVAALTVPPHGGLSHDTLVVRAEVDGEPRRFVVRAEPAGPVIFPEYDLARERRVMEAVRSAGVPAPRVLWFEDDPEVLGRRFFVMEHVAGSVPSDDPPFLLSGFLHDAPPQVQAKAQAATIASMARVHAVDWEAAGLASVLRRDDGAGTTDTLDDEIARWRAYLDWAGADGPLPVLEAAFEWCASRRPRSISRPRLCWGDARYGTVVYGSDLEPTAILDWEMALIGPAELDLGWFLFIHETALMWMPDLEGFVDRKGVIAAYADAAGEQPADVGWYEAWAGLRACAIQAQIARRAHERGNGSLRAREDNPVVASLRRLVDLPAPAESG